MPAPPLSIGIDLGASKIAGALITIDGQVIATRETATDTRAGPATVVAQVAALANLLLAAAHLQPHNVAGVGIGTPGQVDSDTGIVRNAVNLGWKEVHLVAEIKAKLAAPLPVWIQKDANASALGEQYFGAAQGESDFVYLGIGTGLGGGVIANGRLVTGANWSAAELGHLSIDPDGLRCACGLRGCAETILSGPGLLNVVENLLSSRSKPTSHLNREDGRTTAGVLAAARAGDELAQAALAELGRYLGIVLAVCVSVLNPAQVVIGGGLGVAAFDLIEPAAREELARRVLIPSGDQLAILPSSQTSSAVGAACLVWYFSGSASGPQVLARPAG